MTLWGLYAPNISLVWSLINSNMVSSRWPHHLLNSVVPWNSAILRAHSSIRNNILEFVLYTVYKCNEKNVKKKNLINLIWIYTGKITIISSNIQFSDCLCTGEKQLNYVGETNSTKISIPRATNGQIFPWIDIHLPTFIKPYRYNITIHPNLTTLEVKSKYYKN